MTGSSRSLYETLELDRNADDLSVRRAYRKLALKWHPDKNETRKDEATEKFNSITESFLVLSSPKYRAIYDHYGEDGLRNGVPDAFGNVQDRFSTTKSPQDVFFEFFGTKNPFQVYYSASSAEDTFSSFNAALQNEEVPKSSTLEVEVHCTLEDLYTGTMKKVKVTRDRLLADQRTVKPDSKIFDVFVSAGTAADTKILFPKDGNEAPSKLPGDLVFVVKQMENSRFVRDGSSLNFTADISLLEALTGTSVKIKTLDNRLLNIPINEIVHPHFVKSVPNEGMPLLENPKSRGILNIHFRTKFPHELSDAQKAELHAILD